MSKGCTSFNRSKNSVLNRITDQATNMATSIRVYEKVFSECGGASACSCKSLTRNKLLMSNGIRKVNQRKKINYLQLWNSIKHSSHLLIRSCKLFKEPRMQCVYLQITINLMIWLDSALSLINVVCYRLIPLLI